MWKKLFIWLLLGYVASLLNNELSATEIYMLQFTKVVGCLCLKHSEAYFNFVSEKLSLGFKSTFKSSVFREVSVWRPTSVLQCCDVCHVYTSSKSHVEHFLNNSIASLSNFNRFILYILDWFYQKTLNSIITCNICRLYVIVYVMDEKKSYVICVYINNVV